MSITREEIRQLCIAHDRFMAEQASESITRPSPVSEIETDGLIFKDYDNSALQPAHEPLSEGFSEYQADTLAHLIVELRAERNADIARKLAIQGENRELKGMIGSVLTLLGGDKAKSDDRIVELLPNWRKKRDVA
jgi:hypothetical protein